MKALKDGGILKYIERRTGRMRMRILNLFDRTTCWFSQHDIGHRIKESPPRFKMMSRFRVGRTSGGTALLINYSLFWFQKLEAGNKVLFKCWEWIVDCGSCKIMILITYRMPYSFKDPVTTAYLLGIIHNVT